MANLTLVYGLRLLPEGEVAEVGDAALKLHNGREARVTMHLLEGSAEEIKKMLSQSVEAFFDIHLDI
ncbi:MAG TPA: allantoinase [Terriglobales bacterium]|nr:allantoinase [Terriglobales bacterium]